VDSPPLTSNLRYGAGYVTASPMTFFDFTEHGGMGRAVEMCSGLGACRKTLEGTMCPSYMATRKKSIRTRGRANTLRLAMAGRLDEAGLGDEEVREVLDLCLECRACKAECPVGVDVARFQERVSCRLLEPARHAAPRTRVRPRAYAREVGQPVRARVERRGPQRRRPLARRTSARRRSPAHDAGLDVPTFARRFASSSPRSSPSPQPLATSPSFSSTTRSRTTAIPRSGAAATEVLASAGVGVRLAPHVCCGRPMISQGLLDEARTMAQANTDVLHDAASRGEPIVFLEPSCLSAVREDAPSLLRGESQRRAQVVANACVTFEEYVEREWQAGSLELALRPGPPTILLHGHCHQKAMGLAAPARSLLSRIPSAQVVELNAGCCGMAGSFGYSLEHYEVSRQIGERVAAAGRARDAGWRGARGVRRLVPPAGRALHGRRRRASRGPPAFAVQ